MLKGAGIEPIKVKLESLDNLLNYSLNVSASCQYVISKQNLKVHIRVNFRP